MLQRRLTACRTRIVLTVLTAGCMLLVTAARHTAMAGCNLADLVGAIEDTAKKFGSACIDQVNDPFFYVLTAALGTVAADGGSSQVLNACMTLNADMQQLANGSKQLSDIENDLSKLGGAGEAIVSFLKDTGFDPGSSADAITEILAPANCACNAVTNPGLSDLGKDVGACLTDVLSELDCDLFNNCPTTPANPVQFDCTKAPCENMNLCSPDVTDKPWIWGDEWNGQPGTAACAGSICYNKAVTAGGAWCFCPPHMQHWVTDINAGNGYDYMICRCPPGQTPLGATGAAAYACVCPGNVKPNSDQSCPPPPPPCNPSCLNNLVVSLTSKSTCSYTCGCPDGQSLVNDKCVTPCAGPGQVLLLNGTCCLPQQTTTCGTCCPSGMKPNAATGSCVANIIKPNTPNVIPNQTPIPKQL